MNLISINDVAPVRIGQAQNFEAGTGCTAFICPEGMCAGLDVRGGGPASRESQLLQPLTVAQKIHGIVLAGGSAFGLGAADGVMKYLEEQGIGFDVNVTHVPLVAQSDLFDLTVADGSIRPDAAMGYEAAKNALENPNYRDGNYGAGTGCTVGKICGMEYCMKTGIGSHAIEIDGLKIGAVVALNSLGDIYDWKSGKKVAGLLNKEKDGFENTADVLVSNVRSINNIYSSNTTLAVVITNAKFDKSALCKIASLCHDGYARSVRPVHTSFDGDSIYAVSAGDFKADPDVVGTIAADVVSEAILNAVKNAESAYGFPAAKDPGLRIF
ncbi:MAG: P1 family peptidase [Clostridiales bacterium]|nr:P1 family peptidase [Clostridiales bacterium]